MLRLTHEDGQTVAITVQLFADEKKQSRERECAVTVDWTLEGAGGASASLATVSRPPRLCAWAGRVSNVWR